MTSHITKKQSVNQENNQVINKVSLKERKSVVKQTDHQSTQLYRQEEKSAESQSVAALIRARAQRKDTPEVLKTVTLKVKPSLDEKIERYCFENKLKKQEFWAEAAALYFETIGDLK